MIYRSEPLKRLLNALRKHCSLSRGRQARVAFSLNASPSTISDWFHGRKNPTGEQVLSIVYLLGTSVIKTRRKRRRRKGPPKNVTPPMPAITSDKN